MTALLATPAKFDRQIFHHRRLYRRDQWTNNLRRAAVLVNADGKLGTSTSSARFKDEIKPMGKASETLLALQPVTFRYKKEIDPQDIPHFGLVAEHVEKVNPDLIIRDKKASPTRSAMSGSTRCCSTSSSKSTKSVETLRSHGRRSRRNCERADIANPEGERPA